MILKTVTVRELIAALGGVSLGDPETAVARVAPLEEAGPDAIAFLANPKYQAQLAGTQAACVIVSPKVADVAAARAGTPGQACCIVTPDPYLYFARLSQWWVAHMRKPRRVAAVHHGASVAPGA